MFQKLLKSCVCSLVVVSLLVSLTVPVFAVSPDVMASLVGTDFVSWAADQTADVLGLIGSLFDKSVCGMNPNTDKRHDFEKRYTTVDGKTGCFYVCRYCGNSAGEVFEPAYDAYVETLPATNYDSSGKLRYSPEPEYMYLYYNTNNFYGDTYSYGCEHYPRTSSEVSRPILNFDCALNSVRIFPVTGSTRAVMSSAHFSYLGSAPVDGYYKQVVSPVADGYYLKEDGTRGSFSGTFTETSTPVFYTTGATFRSSGSSRFSEYKNIAFTFAFVQGLPPVYEITPASAISSDTYNINTRPTSITGGNYRIVGDNGQITKVEDNSTIINETNNTYYNPATGTTVPITGWTYDYSDRSYKVTMEGGKTSTVTYGDENISITETTVNESGDTITNNYTIYYLIDGSGSENPPSACDHAWTETSTTPATCTMPGSKLLTCSKCQQEKTETIPALGHDWQVKQSVTTEYDDTGQLVQEGYTIYECSRCHEQYKAASGTSPPVNPSDPDASGDGVFSGIFGLLLDFLGFFFKTFKDFTKSGVKAFLGALQDGTSDIFGLLNPFDWSA